VENEEDGLVLRLTGLFLDIRLVLAEELGVQLDVTGFVHAVDVAEAGGNGEVGADFDEGVVDIPDIFWLGVEGVVVDIFVVDTVLFATSDADFLLSH